MVYPNNLHSDINCVSPCYWTVGASLLYLHIRSFWVSQYQAVPVAEAALQAFCRAFVSFFLNIGAFLYNFLEWFHKLNIRQKS